MAASYSDYKTQLRKIADVNYAAALLQWDQETYMPQGGATIRAQQLSTLAGISHELSTSNDFEKTLKVVASDSSLSDIEKKNVAESLYQFNQNKKYSTAFVIELNQTISNAFQSWQEARKQNDFKIFAPQLEKLIQFKRQECELLGYKSHPYNALLNQYERGLTVADLDILFEDVKSQLVPFVEQVIQNQNTDTTFLKQNFDKQKQWDLGIELLKQMQFDFNFGRQDVSSHPFTTSFSSQDVRITTRIDEYDLNEMIWSCLHEGGHALYEQGLNIEDYGLPSGEFISLAIHESQSRLWENQVGRSYSYWKKNYLLLQNYFPEQLQNISLQQFYHAINHVQPSLIRTNADELTYHFHVMIRYEIEKKILDGSVSVNDLPELWNTLYKKYLNIEVPDDANGILQDVHWSHGSFGYFPTYSVGSFYAAQFYAQAEKEIPLLVKNIEAGELKSLLDWLHENIHKHGKIFTSAELCEKITGEKLNFNYFMNYARQKFI